MLKSPSSADVVSPGLSQEMRRKNRNPAGYDSEDEGDDSDLIRQLEQASISGDPSTVKIMTWNVGSAVKWTGSISLNKKIVLSVLQTEYPDILLMQECGWNDSNILANHVPHTIAGCKYSALNIVREAGIIYNSTRFEATKHPIPDNAIANWKLGARMVCVLLKEREPQEGQDPMSLYAASFHGLYKCTEKEKSDTCKAALGYIKSLSSEKGTSVVVGGDFNFDLQKVDLPADMELLHVSQTRRAQNEVIDFFVFSPANNWNSKGLKHAACCEVFQSGPVEVDLAGTPRNGYHLSTTYFSSDHLTELNTELDKLGHRAYAGIAVDHDPVVAIYSQTPQYD